LQLKLQLFKKQSVYLIQHNNKGMQSLHDFCFSDDEYASSLQKRNQPSLFFVRFVNTSAKLALEIVAMLSMVAAGFALTLLGAPVLFFCK